LYQKEKIPGVTRHGRRGDQQARFPHTMAYWGVEDIGRKSVPIQVIVHYPETEEGKRELADRVAAVHADAVDQSIRDLDCSARQKIQLLEEIIKSAGEQTG